MPESAYAQKPDHAGHPVRDTEFCGEFYAPYEAAACAALALLGDARRQMPCRVLTVSYRLKTASSIREKLRRKGLPETPAAAVAALHDVAGLRAVLTDRQAVYSFAAVLLGRCALRLEDVHDYIAAPKQSGYRSLHLIVRVPVCLGGQTYCVPAEIQLRTASMDAWACAEHRLIYKPC
ncbi:MAG: hypothetical protein IKJ11_07010 [Clostridia bacterium]|nr:hypothetical protein [Clostridia bacterium]